MLSRANLHDYQVQSYRRIIETEKIALWLDMGLGKTVTTLTACADLLAIGDIKRVLIIAPLRVANTVWHKEIENWEQLKHLTYSIATGQKAKRVRALSKKSDITIVNKECVEWLVDTHKKDWPYDMVVIDESSCFKSHQAKRFKALKRAPKYIRRMIQLTGTPAPQSLADVWSQIYLLDGGSRLGHNITAFRARYMQPDFNGYGYNMLPGSSQAIYDAIEDIAITMTAKDYLDLQQLVVYTISVPVSISSMLHYTTLEKEFFLELNSGDITAVNAGVLAGKLLQLCNGACYIDESNGSYSVVHDAKIDALKEIVSDNSGENILVAYNFKSDKERLTEAFPNAGVMDKNGECVDSWNRGEIKMLLAHPASAGHGLNLQFGGSMIVWFGLNWSLELYQQFNTRVYRQGQKNTVRIVHLVATCERNGKKIELIDERVLRALNSKSENQNELIEALKCD